MSYPITDLEKQYHAAAERGDMPEAQRLEALVDTAHEAHLASLAAPGALLNAALWYAGTLNLPVFPCLPGQKRPATQHGFQDASTDPDQIKAWWRVNPSYNVAAPTGILFDVMDVDGPEGMIALGEFMDSDGGFPPILGISLTPRGRHYLVPATEKGNTTNVLPQVDYRSVGGYVLLPPSRTPDGIYQWSTPPTALELNA